MNKQKSGSSPFKWGLIILLVLWIFAVTGIFYVTQKPLSPADFAALFSANQTPFAFSAAALGRTTLDILASVWLWLMSLGIGLWIYQWLFGKESVGQINNLSYAEKIIFSFGLGLGAIALLILAIGLAGFISKPVFFGGAIALTLIGLPQLIKLTRSSFGKLRTGSAHPLTRSPIHPLIRIYLFITIALAFTIALLPPTDWDGLFYHLTGPKLHITAGQIRPGIDLPHLNFPGMFEMLFMLGIIIRSEATAKLFHFGFSLLLATLVYLMAVRHLKLKHGWMAALFLFSMPMVLTLAGWAYNDLALAFYQVAALYALLSWRQGDGETRGQGDWTVNLPLSPSPPLSPTRLLILSGIFCGLAMSLKYTSVVAPVTLGGLLMWWLWKAKASPGKALKASLAFGLPAIIIAAPWYIKNWFFTGNPIYPFVFEGLFWDAFRSAAYAGSGTGIGFDPLALLTLPYYLTLGVNDANYIDGRTGPLFLALLPLLLVYGVFKYRKQAAPVALNALLIFALAQFAFWIVGVIFSAGLWQSRLLLPAFVALSPVMAWILADTKHLDHPQFSLNRFLNLFVAVVLILGMVDQVFNNQIGSQSGWLYYRPWSHLIGSETKEAYLLRRLGAHYKTMAEINAQLPEDAVIAFLWEPRSYYCERDCRPDSILDEYGHLQYLHGSNAAAIARDWREAGITHILIFRSGLDFLLEERGVTGEIRPDVRLLEELEANYLQEVIDVVGAYQVYVLR